MPLRESTDRRVYSLQEFLRMLDVSRTRGYQMAQRNELPVKAVRVGRTYKFPKSEVDALLKIRPAQTLEERETGDLQ